MSSVHISPGREYYPLHQLHEDMTKQEWVNYAVDHYGMAYNFDEKTRQEERIVRKNWKALKEFMPEKFKKGVHLIAAGVCFMGESLYVVDGELDHEMHRACKTCGGFCVLERSDSQWCFKCQDFVESVSVLTDKMSTER